MAKTSCTRWKSQKRTPTYWAPGGTVYTKTCTKDWKAASCEIFKEGWGEKRYYAICSNPKGLFVDGGVAKTLPETKKKADAKLQRILK